MEPSTAICQSDIIISQKALENGMSWRIRLATVDVVE
jgi:hypothetical protein